MEHLQTIAVTLTSFAHQLDEQQVARSRIDARLSPFISEVQRTVDLWSLQDSSKFDNNLLIPPLKKLQQKIAAELPYDPSKMAYSAYLIKSAVSLAVVYAQYWLGSIIIPGNVLTQLDFSVRTCLELVKQNRAGSMDEPEVILKRIQDTLDEYKRIMTQ